MQDTKLHDASTFRRTVRRDVTDNSHVITRGRGHKHVTGNSVGVVLQANDVDTVEIQVVDYKMAILCMRNKAVNLLQGAWIEHPI